MSLLELQDVAFAYGDREVLSDVSLRLEAGAAVAVVGPNGAGKTTLLRVAGGLLVPARGRVLLEGHDLAGIPRRAAARRLAAVPAEEEAVFPFTVRESVELGRHAWRSSFTRLGEDADGLVHAALKRTALEPLADRALPALSSGERQRASIARCLVQDAPVCLLDEPTSHLDLGQRLRMLGVFREEARERGRAVLAVLHDLNLAAWFANRILLMVDGRVVADGTPDDVLTPERIESAFGTPVRVMPHPEHGTPVVVPLAQPEATA
ncbi:MAG: ABC transporter ATP-binding protein [Planctomycetota bacterium]|nr:ABC transporter ATP-binding protein [Planctomycetota bacterium]